MTRQLSPIVALPQHSVANHCAISNAYNPAPDTFRSRVLLPDLFQANNDAAGQSLANTEYIAQFSFISTKPNVLQPGLNMDVSPDNGEGGRMSYIGLTRYGGRHQSSSSMTSPSRMAPSSHTFSEHSPVTFRTRSGSGSS